MSSHRNSKHKSKLPTLPENTGAKPPTQTQAHENATDTQSAPIAPSMTHSTPTKPAIEAPERGLAAAFLQNQTAVPNHLPIHLKSTRSLATTPLQPSKPRPGKREREVGREIGKRDLEVEKRRREVEQRERSVERREVEVEDRIAEVEGRERFLDRREGRLGKGRQQVDERKQHVDRLGPKLQGTEHGFKSLNIEPPMISTGPREPKSITHQSLPPTTNPNTHELRQSSHAAECHHAESCDYHARPSGIWFPVEGEEDGGVPLPRSSWDEG